MLDYYDHLIKISIVGNSNVGKTNIIKRFIHNAFDLETKTTIGVDFEYKLMHVDNQFIKLQIWDTAGQERYMAITNAIYKNAKGIIIVYDICDRHSFHYVSIWMEFINKHADINNTKILLLGNKTDLQHKRQVSYIEGRELSEKYKIHLFAEVSALENIEHHQTITIDNAFSQLVQFILHDLNLSNCKSQTITDKPRTISIQTSKEKTPKLNCC